MGTEPRCDQCALKKYWEERGQWNPCRSELRHTGITVITSAPSKTDQQQGLYLMDEAGIDLMDAMEKAGWDRQADYSITGVVACRYPDDDPKKFAAQLRRENKARKKRGRKELLHPIDACEPRLAADIEGEDFLLTLGADALKSVVQGSPSLGPLRGAPNVGIRGKKLLPTVEPVSLRWRPEMRQVFKEDIARAARYHKDELNWEPPEIIWNDLDAFMADLDRWEHERALIDYDWETDGIEPLTANVRCIGIGTAARVHMIQFRTIGGSDLGRYEEWREPLIRFFTSSRITKGGHNIEAYDRMVAEKFLGVRPKPTSDTQILAPREYPRRLAFQGSRYTDAPAWKSEHTALTASSDQELAEYCANDVAVTHRVRGPLIKLAKKRDQEKLYRFDSLLTACGVGMHQVGMKVDFARVELHEARQEEVKRKQEEVINQIAPGLNLNSPQQLAGLLYDKWDLLPTIWTDTGQPSTNAHQLILLEIDPTTTEEQRGFIHALRKWKKAEKKLNSFIRKFLPRADNPHVVNGIWHPNYNATGTVSGRYASDAQQLPFDLRDMLVARPGHLYVGADFDQLELRMAATLAGCEYYKEVFNKGEIDAHNATAKLMFGEEFLMSLPGAPETLADKGKGKFKEVRTIAKTICFLSLYGGRWRKVYESMAKTEDDDGNLAFADLQPKEVKALWRRWHREAPEFKIWWEKQMNLYRTHGYAEEPVAGRRRYFYEDDFNAIVNFPVQAGGFVLVALGMFKLVEMIPFNPAAGTGLVTQFHDAVGFEVPEDAADYWKDRLTEVLTIDKFGMTFSAEGEVGKTWKEI